MKILQKPGAKFGLIALALSLALAALWSYLTEQVDIPEDRTLFVIGFASAIALAVFALVKGAGWIGGVASVAAIAIGALLPFTMAISRQEVAGDGIQVGQAIPSFTAIDDRGEPFDSESLRGHPVLIKFFRAHW